MLPPQCLWLMEANGRRTHWKPQWTCLSVSEIKKRPPFPPKIILRRKILAEVLHQQQGSQEVCQDACLCPLAWPFSQAFLLLPSSALWGQHKTLRKVVSDMTQVRVSYLQYITCGSSTVPYRCQTLVYPCLQPPRWTDHMADHAIWSDSGHCSSCQYLGINTEYLLLELKGPSRIKKK